MNCPSQEQGRAISNSTCLIEISAFALFWMCPTVGVVKFIASFARVAQYPGGHLKCT